jgi:hypothetical protein
MVSDASVPFTGDDITAYSVAQNQSTIVTQGNRVGRTGLFYFEPTALGVPHQANSDPTIGTAITASTVGIPPGLGGSNTGTKVAYDVGVPVAAPDSVGIYVGALPPASPPAPDFVASIEHVLGFNPDDTKLLYTDSSRVFEIASSAGNSGVQLGVGSEGWYDSGGNIVLLSKVLSSGGRVLSSNTRPFGTPHSITPNGTAAFGLDVSGVGRGVTIFGQVADTGNAPSSANLQMVDVASAAATLPITLKAQSASPLNLTSYISRVVSK